MRVPKAGAGAHLESGFAQELLQNTPPAGIIFHDQSSLAWMPDRSRRELPGRGRGFCNGSRSPACGEIRWSGQDPAHDVAKLPTLEAFLAQEREGAVIGQRGDG